MKSSFAISLLFLSTAAFAQSQPAKADTTAKPAPVAAEQQRAEQIFKNIQALKGRPAGDVRPSMEFFTAALGVNCAFCHVMQPKPAFELDDKEEKRTAREMIAMTEAINANSFHGKQEVTCATCHNGRSHPQSMPPVMTTDRLDSAVMQAHGPRPELPKPDDLVAKYEQAIGGAANLAKLNTRADSGTIEMANGKSAAFQSFHKAPDKFAITLDLNPGVTTQVTDGAAGWMQQGEHGRGVEGPDLDQLRYAGNPARDLLIRDEQMRTVRKEKVEGADAFVVRGRIPQSTMTDTLYFDANSGLLLRRTLAAKTPFGYIPVTFDFSDWKEIGGVKFPTTMKISNPETILTQKYMKVDFNAPIDDSKFTITAKTH